MQITVRLFARARDLAGVATLEVEVPPGATTADLRQQLSRCCPALTPILARSALAINEEYAQETQTLPEQAEVALIPPVSGGSATG
jgi:molybdopterin converting factor subunit 1